MSRKTRRNASRNATKPIRLIANYRSSLTKVGISGLTFGAMAFSNPLLAADATGPAPSADNNNNDNALQEVVVTGIRASLQRSMDIKQQAVGVTDAISAEDIGQFPDASIGEAIARIPGITVNRGSINAMAAAGPTTATGAVTGVTVRGFGTQFNELLSNGRPIASGNGQTFDFSALGAEYVGEVDVHKTPDFSLSSGAIGGSIDIKSPNPFDRKGLQARSFVSGTSYENEGSVRPAFGALISDTFADDTIGVLAAFDYTNKRILGHHLDVVGWKGVPNQGGPDGTFLPCSEFAVAPAGSGCTAGGPGYSTKPSWYPQDMAVYLERTQSTRRDGRLALQWHPADNVLVTLDDNYSSDSEVTERWQYSKWMGCFPGNCTDITQDGNGTITNFVYPNGGQGGPTDLNAVWNQTYITTNTPGINVKWDVNDHWSAGFDFSTSDSHLNPNGTWTSVDADTGYGPNTSNGTNGYTGGIATSANSNTLPYFTADGPNSNVNGNPRSPNYLGLNPNIVGSHVFVIQQQMNTDIVNQAKLDATWHTDDTTVHFGTQFVEDSWNTKEYDTLQNNQWQLWSGYGPASNNFLYFCAQPYTDSKNACKDQANPGATAVKVTNGVPLPASFFSTASIANFIPGYKGNANLPQSVALYNPYTVLSYLLKQPVNQIYTGTPLNGQPVPAINPGTVQDVQRKNYSPFVTAEHDFPVNDMTLKANVGVRYQRTDETITGLSAPLTALAPNGGDKTAYTFIYGPETPTIAHKKYGYVLPSLDLNLLVQPNLKVRLDASRTETQPNNNQIIPTVNFTGRVDALSATGNNANLLPYLADNLDLGGEWYYGNNSYLSLDGFFKHVTQFPVSSVTSLTVPGVVNTAGANPGTPAVFAESTVVNGLAANVTGVELIWQQMLPLGFGYQINGTYVHSNANFNPYSTVTNQFILPGIGNSANLIAFYQNHGFQARLAVQFQAKQLLQAGQEQNGGAFGNEPTYLLGNTEVDFTSTYDVNDHLSVFFEAINLNDNVYHTTGRFDNQTLNVVDYGRSFTFGVRAKL